MSERSTTAALARMLADEIDDNQRLAAECIWAAQTIGALVDDLEDTRAEWARDASSKAAGLSLFSTELTTAQNRPRSELALADARIAELEALDRQQVERVDELTGEIAGLESVLAEESRLRRAAFERNAELEKQVKATAAELRRLVELNRTTPVAGDLMVLALALDGPKAPSVPRRETPGTEVSV